MPTAFPPPVNVSPLIKLIRWTLLVSGIAYGTVWQKRHYAAELSLRDIRIQEKAARDKVLAEEKLRLNEEQMFDLARQLAGKKATQPEASVMPEESEINPSESVIDLPPKGRLPDKQE